MSSPSTVLRQLHRVPGRFAQHASRAVAGGESGVLVLGYYRAVALDLNGTLSCGSPPDPVVIDALRTVLAQGVRALLVTGRVLAELEADMPGLIREFDALVAENGGVLAVPHHHTAGGDFSRWARDVPRDPALAKRLRHSEGHTQARVDDERHRSELLQATASRYRLG